MRRPKHQLDQILKIPAQAPAVIPNREFFAAEIREKTAYPGINREIGAHSHRALKLPLYQQLRIRWAGAATAPFRGFGGWR
jgi:hypothetical protein